MCFTGGRSGSAGDVVSHDGRGAMGCGRISLKMRGRGMVVVKGGGGGLGVGL
jgi:hypothetical protein